MEKFPLPKSITEVSYDKRAHRAVFAVEPLYPGYGMTVGNALRRVLLSSLPGAAITHVKIDGVTHEFTTLPHVKEDMVDVLLNIKQIRFRLHSDEPVTVSLSVKGAMTVTAGDIAKNSDVEVINTKQEICTITDAAGKVEMEFTVAKGRGYVPVENREKEKLDIGMIAVDAIYTPVKNVNFTTEHVRVEQITNFDKLMLDITTDGSISPADALNQSAQILLDHFQFILQGPMAAEEATETPPAEEGMAEPAATEANDEDEKPKKKRKKKADDAE